MKRGVFQKRIALAVTSIIAIMTVFAIVLIMSGRTVQVTGRALEYNPSLGELVITESNPCFLLRCMEPKEPILLGYEGVPPYNEYALCVCAMIRQGRAYYDELQIKKIQTIRPY